MKICFLAPATSIHTKKWCKFFNEKGNEVHVISFVDGRIENVTVHYVPVAADAAGSDFEKILYLFQAKKVRDIINQIQPDIVNAHYATSYGAVAALSGIKNYVLSVWGSDIYDFPQRSFAHKLLLQFSLNRAQYLFSTSKAMADEARKYTKKDFTITPFGVDTELFNPNKRTRCDDSLFVIGTVKALSYKYGIDYLLKAVAIIHNAHPDIPLKLRIAGKGENESDFKSLAEKLGIADITTWLGFISQEEAAKEWANMDVAIVYSSYESFGVSAVEAQACGVPLIVSDVPGLLEATRPEETSFVVKKNNEYELAKSIMILYKNEKLRKKMGNEATMFISHTYEYMQCFKIIEDAFSDIKKKRD